jgi:hypothetical protein
MQRGHAPRLRARIRAMNHRVAANLAGTVRADARAKEFLPARVS